MAGYRFLPEARRDLASAVAWYDSEFPDLGKELAREAKRLCLLIAVMRQRRRPDHWQRRV